MVDQFEDKNENLTKDIEVQGVQGLADRARTVGADVTTYLQTFARELPDRSRELAERSRELAGRIDQSARANPWMHIGAVGVGALALGYLLGRRISVEEE